MSVHGMVTPAFVSCDLGYKNKAEFGIVVSLESSKVFIICNELIHICTNL